MKIRFKRSVRILNVGEESWNVFDVRDKVQEGETELEARERITKLVYDAHEKYSQSIVGSQVAPVKDKRQTFEDLKRELNVTSK